MTPPINQTIEYDQNHSSATTERIEVNQEEFDWESYISAYKGRTKIDRLLFLAEKVSSLRQTCANAALELVKTTTKDVQLYHRALYIRNTKPEAGSPLLPKEERQEVDVEWCESTEKANRVELEKLDLELRNYQNNLIKESIRMGYRDLGDQMRRVGSLHDAFKYYINTRDYCSTNEHLVEMCLNVIEVSLEMKEFNALGGYVSKAEGLLDDYDPQAAAASAKSKASGSSASTMSKGGTTSGADAIGALFRAGGSAGSSNDRSRGEFQRASDMLPNQRESETQGKRHIREIRARLYVAQGLANMSLGRYGQAVASFLEVGADVGNAYASMASRNDVATYIVLCGIAILDRKELKARVIDRQGIHSMLEDNTQAQQLLESFYACEYKRALSLLDKLQTRALLDVILAPHFHTLSRHIVQRALRQFVQPFDTLQVHRLATSLGWSDEQGRMRALNELLHLIQSGDIAGRLDLQNNVLLVDKVDSRQALFEDAIKTGNHHISTAKGLMLRVSLLQNGLIAKASQDNNNES
ncbi:uncharacterized protein FA14DRAFT_124575 [Meira miltonrushii]|uniref:PCI domain-containing protein n=1 Tax=Meira miltonrushii TaxID=1280837 RepID=A0A316V8W4_9BASI|nr:uncharacterized protein FA14DRAFT_124575 [Meira miltonrushii]PWN33966.1 hypothetical protein FA14DRAFT_124575 [Meira miltonrushii]